MKILLIQQMVQCMDNGQDQSSTLFFGNSHRVLCDHCLKNSDFLSIIAKTFYRCFPLEMFVQSCCLICGGVSGKLILATEFFHFRKSQREVLHAIVLWFLKIFLAYTFNSSTWPSLSLRICLLGTLSLDNEPKLRSSKLVITSVSIHAT